MSDPEVIAGVRVLPLPTIVDERGGFTELFRQDWLPVAPPMAQCNLSRSRAGVLRGMHVHRRQADYSCVVRGSALAALFDLRKASPTHRLAQTVELQAGDRSSGVYVPPGVAHGFFAHEEMLLLYLVDRAFDGKDEFGFAWNDPDLPIEWPTVDPILSRRDAEAPRLADVVHLAPDWG